MEPIIETSSARSDVLASFLIPHCLLDFPADGDTPELRRDKARRNKVWLQRWLPTYIVRWALIFVATWMATSVAVAMDLPWLLDSILEFGQYASAGMAFGLTCLYVLARYSDK